MSELYSKVEIIRPKLTAEEAGTKFFAALFGLAIRVLIVWWFCASWFPELGLTYWQLILAVYAVRCLILPQPFIPRTLK